MAPTEPAKHRVGEIACDEVLFDKLRGLRKQLADERGVPPYIIFSDVSLRQMARFYPANGEGIFAHQRRGRPEIARVRRQCSCARSRRICRSNPRQIFADDSFAGIRPLRCRAVRGLTDTVRETLHFFRQGKTVSEIARVRGVKDGTIYSHLEEAMLAGEAIDVNVLVSADAQREIAAAFKKHGFGNLGGVVESLGGKYGYGECRIVRAAMQKA